jgi:ERCC4-related helicase
MTSADTEVRLLPHQLEFYRSFRSDDSPKHQLLLAPPGLGKGFVAQALAHGIVQADAAARVLVIAPRALTSAFAEGIAELTPVCRVDIVDRRRLREILSNETGEVWPSGTVFVMSTDFAKRHDVLELLAATRWSLAIVDEVHSLEGLRRELVRRLVDHADRLLLLSATGEPSAIAAAVPDLEVVRWQRDVVDARGKPLFPSVPRARHVIEYERSDAEAGFVREALAVIDRFGRQSDLPQSALVRRMMLNALASSPNAIEQFLLRQLDDRRLPHAFEASSTEPPSDEGVEVASGDEFVGYYASMWEDARAASSALQSLVAQLDALPIDSKAVELGRLVSTRIQNPSSRTCVFSMFTGTAEYLAAVLDDVTDVQILTGRMTQEERAAALQEFEEGGGTLVATGAAYGIDLALADAVVHYDLPEGRLQMEQRWGRFDRVGQTRTVNGYVFRDVRQTLDWEEQLLRRHGFVQ